MLLKWHRLVYLTLLLFLSLFFTCLSMLYYQPWARPQFVIKSDERKGGPHGLKHTRLVLGDAAGQGVAGRVQCEGLTALVGNKKMGLTNGSCLPTKGERVSFVTFFVPPNEGPSHDNNKIANEGIMEFGNFTLSKADRPYTILTIFLESLQISNPGSVATILTDQISPISTSRLPVDVSVYRTRGNFARNNLMLQRLESYIDFLGDLLAKLQARKNKEAIEHIIFMDADIIVVDDLQCLFKTYTDFDIALTFRNNKDQPINSGVMMVWGEAESVSRARGFLMDVVKLYKAEFAKAARMLGDQLSLAAIVKKHSDKIGSRFRKPMIFKSWILEGQVLFLPSQDYNWTPSEGAGQFHGMPEDVKVLHFKGSRKRLMIEAWNFFKHSQRSFSDMKCLILRSGRAKYDF